MQIYGWLAKKLKVIKITPKIPKLSNYMKIGYIKIFQCKKSIKFLRTIF
jgi:hypothetical protein